MSVVRLHVTAEGQTEKRFVRTVLCPHLGQFNVSTDVRSVLTSKDRRTSREFRGGFRRRAAYATVKKDIACWLKEDQNADARFTTMFDLSALPETCPGHEVPWRDPYDRVVKLDAALAKDIADRRFIPYIQLHEFEALIRVEPRELEWEYLEHDVPIGRLEEMTSGENPELIDDGEQTAPSKRILREIPEYDKATAGPVVAEKIGITKLRGRCRHFGEWLGRLESLASG